MKSFKHLVLFVIFLGIAFITPATVMALQQPEYGGNNSADYQPPTRNPQGDTATGLQPNSTTSLQPVPLGINPQNLVQGGGLQVFTSADKGASSTASGPPAPKKSTSTLPTWIIGGIVTLIVVVYVVRTSDTKTVTTKPTPIVEAEAPTTKLPIKSKPLSKKTTRKQRKAAQK